MPSYYSTILLLMWQTDSRPYVIAPLVLPAITNHRLTSIILLYNTPAPLFLFCAESPGIYQVISVRHPCRHPLFPLSVIGAMQKEKVHQHYGYTVIASAMYLPCISLACWCCAVLRVWLFIDLAGVLWNCQSFWLWCCFLARACQKFTNGRF
jgi:hypothetical protein